MGRRRQIDKNFCWFSTKERIFWHGKRPLNGGTASLKKGSVHAELDCGKLRACIHTKLMEQDKIIHYTTIPPQAFQNRSSGSSSRLSVTGKKAETHH